MHVMKIQFCFIPPNGLIDYGVNALLFNLFILNGNVICSRPLMDIKGNSLELVESVFYGTVLIAGGIRKMEGELGEKVKRPPPISGLNGEALC